MNDKSQEEILARKATEARERLIAVVDELDRKRHKLAHPVQLVSRKLPPPIGLVSIGAMALIAIGSIGFLVTKLRVKRRRPERRLLAAANRFRPPPPPSFWNDVGTRTAKALVTFGLIETGKVAMRRAASRVTAPVSVQAF